jgi:hypothetical protein
MLDYIVVAALNSVAVILLGLREKHFNQRK